MAARHHAVRERWLTCADRDMIKKDAKSKWETV
jgi:hypothetical protein